MCITTTNFLNSVDYDKDFPILVFEYEGNFFKVLPDENTDLKTYADNNLLSGIRYKIFDTYSDILNLTIQDIKTLFEKPDGLIE
jgi:hypothetical protein